MTQIVASPFAAAVISGLLAGSRAVPSIARRRRSVRVPSRCRGGRPRRALAALEHQPVQQPFPGGGGCPLLAGAPGVPRPTLADRCLASGAVTEPFSTSGGWASPPHTRIAAGGTALPCVRRERVALLARETSTGVRVRPPVGRPRAGAFISTFGTIFLAAVRNGGYELVHRPVFRGRGGSLGSALSRSRSTPPQPTQLARTRRLVALSILLVHFALQSSLVDFSRL